MHSCEEVLSLFTVTTTDADDCSMLPKDTQTVLFSATFPPNVISYANRFAPNANVLTLAHEELTIEGIKQLYIDIDKDNDKYATLLKFYGLMTQASSIIFVRVSIVHYALFS